MSVTKQPTETQMPTQTKPTALDAYVAAHADALALIERIHEAIENHDISPAPEQITWSDISHTRGMLQEVSDSLFAEGEYAPEGN
jgi:hypothetical protein